MGRLQNARTGHVSRWVLPAASRLLIARAERQARSEPLDSVAEIVMGSSPKGDTCNLNGEGVPLIGGPSDLGLVHPKPSRWTTAPTKLTKPDDILVCVRATIGEPRWSDGEYCLGRGLAAIRPRNGKVDRKFLFHVIEGNQDHLREQGTGTTFRTISKRHLETISVPMLARSDQHRIGSFLAWLARHDGEHVDFSNAPSLPSGFDEQRRIVAKIEQLAVRIDEAAGLRERCSCDLDALGTSNLRGVFNDLTEHYGTTLLGELLVEAGYGTSAKCDVARLGDMMPILRIPNVASENIDLANLKYAPLGDRERRKVDLVPGDILVVRTNGSADLVGRCAVVPRLGESIGFASYLIRLRCDGARVSAHYVQRMLRSLRASGKLFDLARTTAGQYNVSLGRLRTAELPVPPLDEQHRIVAYLDDLQEKADRLKALQSQTAAELDALLPSILDKAFKGGLC